jgi:hypothetical protein
MSTEERLKVMDKYQAGIAKIDRVRLLLPREKEREIDR